MTEKKEVSIVKKLLMAAAAAATASTAAFGAGFGIYEASARGNAVGGALVGDAGDATANYYNPANTTNKWMLSKPVALRIGRHVFCY